MAWTAPHIEVGTWVQWFIHGDPGDKPLPAVVMEIQDRANGVLELKVTQKRQPARMVTSVRNREDPFFLTCTPEYRQSRGWWQLIPEAPAPEAKAKAQSK